MSAEQSVYRRVLRRETHSSRAAAAIAVAVCLIVVLAAAGTACVLTVLHAPAAPLLRTGFSQAAALRPELRPPVLIAGLVALVLGVVVVLTGILPGRRPRRRLESGRSVVVIDDSAIADTLAARVATTARVTPGQVRTVVARRRVIVRVVPTSGAAVDVAAVTDSLALQGAEYGLTREPRVLVAEHGTVG